jgi:hypothetical protein
MRRRWAWIAGLLLAMGAAASTPRDVQQVKAAYVLNFLRFTEWPGRPRGEDEFVLAVVGTREFADTLREIAREAERLGQKPVRVQQLDAGATRSRLQRALGEADAVFVQSDALVDAQTVLALSASRPVLTIGDVPGFAAAGGMLGLVPRGQRIVFDANPRAIQASGLQVSAKVLKLANIVEPSQ